MLLAPNLDTFTAMSRGINDTIATASKRQQGFDQGFLHAYYGDYAWTYYPPTWLVNGEGRAGLMTTAYPSGARGFHFYSFKPWLFGNSAGTVWWWRCALDACHTYDAMEGHRQVLAFAVQRVGIDRLLEGEAWAPAAGGGRAWLEGLLV